VLRRIGEATAYGAKQMHIIACVIVAATVASCASSLPNGLGRSEEKKSIANQAEPTLALRILRELSGAHAAQVRLDVKAMLRGMAEAHGTQLAAVPELQRVSPE